MWDKLKGFGGDILNKMKNGELKGIRDILKVLPPKLKALSAGLTLLIGAVKKYWKTVKKAVDDYRDVNARRKLNGEDDFNTKVIGGTISGFDRLTRVFNEGCDAIKRTIAYMASAGLAFYNWLSKLIPNALKDSDSELGNELGEILSSNYTSDEQINNKSLIESQARNSGMNSKEAGNIANRLWNEISATQANSSVDKEKFNKAMQNFMFGGDIKGLQELGFNITEEAVKALMYEHGFDVSGNTKYADSVLVEERLGIWEEIKNLSSEQLQELYKQGFVLENINKNFAWEDVETISGISFGKDDKTISSEQGYLKSKAEEVAKTATEGNIQRDIKSILKSELIGFQSLAESFKNTTGTNTHKVEVEVFTNDPKFIAEVKSISGKEIYNSNNDFRLPTTRMDTISKSNNHSSGSRRLP